MKACYVSAMRGWKKQKENGNMKYCKICCFVSSIMLLITTGCQREPLDDKRDADNYYASVEAFSTNSRTSIDEGNKVVWSGEDCIAIFENLSSGQAFQILDSFVGKSSGEFSQVEGLMTKGTSSVIDAVLAVYPFHEDLIVNSVGSGSYAISGIVFPSEQKYSAGSFADEAFPMAGIVHTDNRNITFRNIGGVLKLRLLGDYSVSRITLTGNSGEPLSGPADVFMDSNGMPTVVMSDEASESVTLLCAPAVQLDPVEVTEFYISIPPTDFKSGFTVLISDVDGNSMQKISVKSNVVGRSVIHSMPQFIFDPSIPYESTENYIELGIGEFSEIVSYDETTGRLALSYVGAYMPEFKSGKAFVMPEEYLFDIRVIEDYSVTDQEVVLNTVQGNMNNLFKNISFTLATDPSVQTRSGDGIVFTPCAYGYLDENNAYHEVYSIDDHTRSAFTKEWDIWSFYKDYNNVSLYDGAAGRLWWETCSFDAGLKGSIKFDFGKKELDEVHSIGELKGFGYRLTGTMGMDLMLKYKYENSYSEKFDEIIQYNVIPTKVFRFPPIGGVPVVVLIYTHLGQHSSFSAEGNVEASLGVNMSSQVEIGLEWTQEGGVVPIAKAEADLMMPHPYFQAQASATAKISYYPQIEIGVYKFIGPWIEPRPYLREDIQAGFRVSTDGGNYIGWRADTYNGLDMRMGLKFDFGFWDKEVWKSDVFNALNKPLFHAPERITTLTPKDGVEVAEGESVTVEFLVESYSPVTGSYYPCPLALVNFSAASGELSVPVAVSDAEGKVSVEWIPDVAQAKTRADMVPTVLTAKIVDKDNETIDDATLTIMKKKDEDPERPTPGQCVDLGLKVKWAGWNVGATKPEEYGGYYAWGEKNEKNSYLQSDYIYYNNYTGICTYIGSNISGTQYDVAMEKWGADWRMPTIYDYIELVNNCTWEETVYNGVAGHFVIGPNGNSIFIPYAGAKAGTSLSNQGKAGFYWAANLMAGSDNDAYYVKTNSSGPQWNNSLVRSCGFSIRPVTQ